MRTLLVRLGDAERILGLSLEDAVTICSESPETVRPLLEPADPASLATQARRLAASGARLISLLDDEYPALLREMADPPPLLFARGVELPRGPAVAIVGARRATRQGLEAARLLAGELARRGVVVVSGFARGVDAEAHRAALAAGGPTVAVLGCGVDVCYPPEQEEMLREIAAKGTILSELPMGQGPQPFFFPVRNRIIAGLCRLTLVVEAAERSGSLITARCAADYGRDVAAVPGSILSPHAAGSNALLKDGAILVLDAEDVLRELPGFASRVPVQAGLFDGVSSSGEPAVLARLPDDARAVWRALDPVDGRDADELSSATGLPTARLAAALVTLELDSLAEALPGGLFLRRGA